MRLNVLVLAASFIIPASAMDLKFDKDTAIKIWRCGEVAGVDKVGKSLNPGAPPSLPEYCRSIGESIGEIKPSGAP